MTEPRDSVFRAESFALKSLRLLLVLGLVAGCSSAWKDTGVQGPWCAPDSRGRVFYRSWPTVNGPRQGEVAYADASGSKKSQRSFSQELNDYFRRAKFIKEWREGGTVGSVRQHFSPFDLCLVSMDPTVIIGVQRKDPNVSSLDSPATKKYVFVRSPYLDHFIEVRTTLPYHSGAKVVWFSPAVDDDLHDLDLKEGKGSFTIDQQTQISVAADGAQLTTSRK
jgi:hypothetical protein